MDEHTLSQQENLSLLSLGKALERVDLWLELVTKDSGAWKVSAGSDLHDDDAIAYPYNVSSAAWHAITAAVSHMDSFRVSLFQPSKPGHVEARISTHGQFSLIRGTLENATRGIWLLRPDNRQERVLRRLQQDWNEQEQIGEAAKILGTPPQRTATERRNELKAVASAVGVPNPTTKLVESFPGYGKIVKLGAEDLPGGSKLSCFIWRACSALAHGDLRGALAYSVMSKEGEVSPGVTLGRLSGNVELLTTGAKTAIVAVDQALSLYARRAGVTVGPLGLASRLG